MLNRKNANKSVMEVCKKERGTIMNLLKVLRFYLLIHLFLLNVLVAESSDMVVILPNPHIIGHKVRSLNGSQLMLEKNFEDEKVIYPRQLIIDITNNGTVTAIKASYDNLTSFKMIEDEINKNYRKWLLKEFLNTDMRLWRVEPYKFAISLSKEKDCIEIIILPFKKI